jgi:phosphomannomutase
VPGTVLRVETDNGGVYEAHIRKADGTEVEVKVDKSFNVTAVNELSGDRHGGGRGRGRGARADLAAVAKKLGVTEAKLRDAVQAARTAGHGDRGAELAADLAKALGVDASKVQSILDANRPQRGPGAGRPDDSALVSALAKGLSKSEADIRAALDKVRQANRAGHEAREAALYAAVAKALGKTIAEVKAACEAARPTP